jgi:predicted phosphodiesterase
MKIGIITDIHEDIVSLRAAFKILETKGCNEIACLGDITGFELPYYNYRTSRSAHDCLTLVRNHCSIIVAGNHDLYNVRAIPNHRSGFRFPADWYDLDYEDRKILAGNQVWLYEPDSLSSLLGRSEKEFLASLPEFTVTEVAGKKILFSHALFPDPTGSLIWGIEDVSSFARHMKVLEQHHCDLGFSGHFHPGGAFKASRFDFSSQGFGKFKTGNEPLQIVAPCVAQGEQPNGVLTYDTVRNEVEVIPIKNKNS